MHCTLNHSLYTAGILPNPLLPIWQHWRWKASSPKKEAGELGTGEGGRELLPEGEGREGGGQAEGDP